jgi:hypothetical protein
MSFCQGQAEKQDKLDEHVYTPLFFDIIHPKLHQRVRGKIRFGFWFGNNWFGLGIHIDCLFIYLSQIPFHLGLGFIYILCIVSNICFRVSLDGFGLSLQLLVQKYLYYCTYNVHSCNLLLHLMLRNCNILLTYSCFE